MCPDPRFGTCAAARARVRAGTRNPHKMSDNQALSARVWAEGGETLYTNEKGFASKCGSGPMARLVTAPEEGTPVGKLFAFAGRLWLRRAPADSEGRKQLHLVFVSLTARSVDKCIPTRTILRIQPIHDCTTEAAGVRITYAQTPKTWHVFNLLFVGHGASDNKNACANFLGRLAQHDPNVIILPRAWRAHSALPVSAAPAAASAPAAAAPAVAAPALPATDTVLLKSGEAYIDSYTLENCHDILAWGSGQFTNHTARCEALTLELGRLFLGEIPDTHEAVLSFRSAVNGVRTTIPASRIDHIGIYRGAPAEGNYVRLNFGRPSGRRLHIVLRVRGEFALRTFLRAFCDVSASDVAPAWTPGTRTMPSSLSTRDLAVYYPLVSLMVRAAEPITDAHPRDPIDTGRIKPTALRLELVKTAANLRSTTLILKSPERAGLLIDTYWIRGIHKGSIMGVTGYTDYYRINYVQERNLRSITFEVRNVYVPTEAASKFRRTLEANLPAGLSWRTVTLIDSTTHRPGEATPVVGAAAVAAAVAAVAAAPAPALAPAMPSVTDRVFAAHAAAPAETLAARMTRAIVAEENAPAPAAAPAPAPAKPPRPTMKSGWLVYPMPTGTFLMPAFHPFVDQELFQLRNQNAMALVLPKYRRNFPQLPTIDASNFEAEVIDKILALPVVPPIACADPKRVWKQNVVDALNCHHYMPGAYEVKRPDLYSIHDPWSKLVTETDKIGLDICVGLDGGPLHKVPDRMLLHNLLAGRKEQQDLIEKDREAIRKWDEEHAEVFESAPSMTYEEAFAKRDREARKRSIDLT